MRKTYAPGTKVTVTMTTIGGLFNECHPNPDGYEGGWYVIQNSTRDGDHLLDKQVDGDGTVWINECRLSPAR